MKNDQNENGKQIAACEKRRRFPMPAALRRHCRMPRRTSQYTIAAPYGSYPPSGSAPTLPRKIMVLLRENSISATEVPD